MAITRTLQDLRDETLQRADMASSSQFIPTAELDNYIRKALMNLIDLVIDNGGEDYVDQFDTNATTVAGGRIVLGANAYRIMSVWRPDGAKRWRVLPANHSDVDTLYRIQYAPTIVQYRIVGGLGNTSGADTAVEFLPEPPLGTPFIIRQVPTPVLPTLATDSWRFQNGWEEYVTLDAAIRCVSKEEGDTSELRAERAEAEKRIIGACQNEDTRWPHVVEDVSRGWNDDEFFYRRRGGW